MVPSSLFVSIRPAEQDSFSLFPSLFLSPALPCLAEALCEGGSRVEVPSLRAHLSQWARLLAMGRREYSFLRFYPLWAAPIPLCLPVTIAPLID